MKPFFGFTLAGIMMLSIVVVASFSVMGNLGLSSSSEKSISKEVDSALNLDNPQMCLNFDDPQFCVSNFAYMKRDPGLCNSMLDDEKQQYECISKFFRKYQEQACTFVSDNYHSQCMIDIQQWKN